MKAFFIAIFCVFWGLSLIGGGLSLPGNFLYAHTPSDDKNCDSKNNLSRIYQFATFRLRSRMYGSRVFEMFPIFYLSKASRMLRNLDTTPKTNDSASFFQRQKINFGVSLGRILKILKRRTFDDNLKEKKWFSNELKNMGLEAYESCLSNEMHELRMLLDKVCSSKFLHNQLISWLKN